MSDDGNSDLDADAVNTPPRQKRKYKNKSKERRKQAFRKEWLTMLDFKYWLEECTNDPYRAKCTICKVEFTAELTVIKTHAKGTKHLKNEKAKSSTNTNVLQSYLNENANATKRLEIQTKEAELKICGFLAEHNISFLTMEHLQLVLNEAFPDSAIAKNVNFGRTKATAIVKNVIGETHKEQLTTKLKNHYFSILIDESTDIATTKNICIVVRYFDTQSCKIESNFWELCPVFSTKDVGTIKADAEHIFNTVMSTFHKRDIPIENIIGFGSDGCNTMMGRHNSVASRMKELCPNIQIFKCICHSMHLCASEACKKLPRNCEDLARNIFSFFSLSAKRQCEYAQFQHFVNIEVHKLLHPSQTRWLSLSAVVGRILEQWPALQLYFNEKWLQEKLISAEQIHNSLNDPFIKLYYLFLDWILPKFSHINQYFQSDKVVIQNIYSVMTSTYKELLFCYMDKAYVLCTHFKNIEPDNKSKYLEKQRLYLGCNVMAQLNNDSVKERPDLIDYFLNKCLDFISTGCVEIKKRFDFNDPVLPLITVLQPNVTMSLEDRNCPSLLPLMQLLPRLADSSKWQNIDDQWRRLPLFQLPKNISTLDTIDEFWGKLFMLKNNVSGDYLFQDLSKFVLGILSLPHSNAECERIFSKINLVKTKTRNRLITDTINGVVLASQCIKSNGSCTNFKPSKEMLSKMTKSMYKTQSNETDEFSFDL